MQRAAPADAACCANTCSALHFPHRNDTFPKSPRSFSPGNPLLHLPKSASCAFGGFSFPKGNSLLHLPKSASRAIGGFSFSPDNTLRSPWNSALHAFEGFFVSEQSVSFFPEVPSPAFRHRFPKARLRIRDRSEALFLVWNPAFKNRPWCGSWRQPSASPGRRTHGS